ncbi:MAG TPA: LacI family DNA-binding transcriptional regulator [Ktedonobacterales bacterium]|nr:LacI family DNA-binding transcriptional regulator [Ktedonobacterales bacterium]
MSLTLKELGRLAGVHPSTVARVLNDDPHQRVSDEVRQRILALAAERGYQPNRLAQSLRTKRSYVIGTLIPDIANPFFALMFRGIEDALAERDFSVILANTDDEYAREERGVAMLRGRQVDGLILATARRHDRTVERLVAEKVPFVLVNRHTEATIANAVVPADYAGSMMAVTHLIELGHRRIAHIAGSDEMSTGATRQRGYRDALDRHDIPFDPDLLVEGSYRESGGYEAMRRLLELADPPTGIFAVNDLAAAGAIRALREARLHVPRDVSLVGFNDLSVVAPTAPSLTTVQLPVHAMGRAAADRLLAQVLGEATFSEPMILPVTLVVRESSARAPARSRRANGRTGQGDEAAERPPTGASLMKSPYGR